MGIRNALAIPANDTTHSIDDIAHIVVLMQENRSFDHYFGTLRGVRGYTDRRAIMLPTGNPVWTQPLVAGYGQLPPYRPATSNLGMKYMQGMLHDWATTHFAWNGGRYDQWVLAKGPITMAYLTREDIPFHYALADAFTICDAYHCSSMAPTDPNRYYMWTGGLGNDCTGGGPVVDNAEAGYSWSTFPEKLQAAGISWKIYQDIGLGLDANGSWGWTQDPFIGTYGDNSLLYFNQYRNAQPGKAAGPYGLGPRVPMLVVSPWSKGGWVCSETFDHTSIIRFIERRFGHGGSAVLPESNITAWRRAICGDLTSAFDFANPNAAFPVLPGTDEFQIVDRKRHFSYIPLPPFTASKPVQEAGVRPARPLPYELFAYGSHTINRRVAGGDIADVYVDARSSHGWYDLVVSVDIDPSFERVFAGHVETGRSSMSDPAFGIV